MYTPFRRILYIHLFCKRNECRRRGLDKEDHPISGPANRLSWRSFTHWRRITEMRRGSSSVRTTKKLYETTTSSTLSPQEYILDGQLIYNFMSTDVGPQKSQRKCLLTFSVNIKQKQKSQEWRHEKSTYPRWKTTPRKHSFLSPCVSHPSLINELFVEVPAKVEMCNLLPSKDWPYIGQTEYWVGRRSITLCRDI